MAILLFSTSDDYYHYLKFCFPCTTIDVAYNYGDFRRPLQRQQSLTRKHYELICYHCDPSNAIESFNRLADLLDMQRFEPLVAFSDAALQEKEIHWLTRKGIKGILSITANAFETMNSLQKILSGESVIGPLDDITQKASAESRIGAQLIKRKIRRLGISNNKTLQHPKLETTNH